MTDPTPSLLLSAEHAVPVFNSQLTDEELRLDSFLAAYEPESPSSLPNLQYSYESPSSITATLGSPLVQGSPSSTSVPFPALAFPHVHLYLSQSPRNLSIPPSPCPIPVEPQPEPKPLDAHITMTPLSGPQDDDNEMAEASPQVSPSNSQIPTPPPPYPRPMTAEGMNYKPWSDKKEKRLSGKDYDLPEFKIITDHWDTIVDSALFLQHSNMHPPSPSLTHDSSLDDMELDDLDPESSPSPSPHTPGSEWEDGEILIFDGKDYVPISPHTDPSPMITDPLADPHPTSTQSSPLPNSNTYYYERKSSDPDLWGHLDANSWTFHAHGVDLTALFPNLTKLEMPPGHPIWCKTHGAPVIKTHFSTAFQGSIDNHPLRNWDNQILVYSVSPSDSPDKLFHIITPFLKTYNILRHAVVLPEDWEGKPNTPNRREVRYQVWKAYQVWKHSPSPDSPVSNSCPSLKPDHLPSDFRTSQDNPALWKDQPLGRKGTDPHFHDSYPIPYTNPNDIIAFNRWNPNIVDLRIFRHLLESAFIAVSQYLLTPDMRRFFDQNFGEEDDTHHFFYHHNPFFRYIDSSKPVHVQGFSCHCHHYDKDSLIYPYPLRTPLPPRNPLLTPEEDEFLHHASYVFESMGKFELVNAMRRVRDVIPFLPDDARILFDAGYLTPFNQYDENGTKYPLLWNAPPLHL